MVHARGGAVKIEIMATSQAEPSVVYARLCDGASWPTFSRLGSFELEAEGEGGGEGVGAIRVFRTRISGRTYTSREQIVELIPDRKLSYQLLSGLAVRDYRAEITLEPIPGGTEIHWRSTFDPKFPGTGGLYRRSLTRLIQELVNGLAETPAQERTRALPSNARDRRTYGM
jgi:hypothetical protein